MARLRDHLARPGRVRATAVVLGLLHFGAVIPGTAGMLSVGGGLAADMVTLILVPVLAVASWLVWIALIHVSAPRWAHR
jgi:hypothetical protein